MNRKNTIPLFACIILVCAGVFVLAQTKQDTNENAPVDKITNNSQNSQQTDNRYNFKPKDGYVPDEETAISIAIAVWKPIYGKEKIEKEKPYKANLKNGVWTVTGSLPKGQRKGGVAEAEIAKDDGRILRIIHGK